jgi:hypothetical protein
MKENEMTLKQDLQALNNDIKEFSKTVDNLLKAAGKSEKPKAAKKPAAKPVKAKSTKKVPAKIAPAKKKTAKPTATDKVLKIIRGSKRGVNAATLVKKTGFNQKKVTNILQRTYKQGKIMRVGKGIYVGV